MRHAGLIFSGLMLVSVCAPMGAQTLTKRYVELADSADYYMKREQWRDAERVIVTALRHEPANPSNWLLWSNLGVVRTHSDDYKGAMEAYDVGLASAPKSTVLLSNRAWTQLSFGHRDEALKDIDATLALDSLQAWPLKMRGLLRLSHPDSAERDLLKADELSPRDPAVLAGLGDIRAARGDLDKALDYYAKSLDIEPDQDVTFKQLLILTEHGDFRQAQDKTIAALAKWPKNPNLHIVRAMQHRKSYQQDAELKEKNLALAYGADPLLVDRLLGQKSSKK